MYKYIGKIHPYEQKRNPEINLIPRLKPQPAENFSIFLKKYNPYPRKEFHSPPKN